jgi:hypothetical protein
MPDMKLICSNPLAFSIALAVLLSALAACSSPNPDRDALMALYESTNGDDWNYNLGWGNRTDVCMWWGVTCNDDGSVTDLELAGNHLTGTIPSELGNLSNLEVLDLTGLDLAPTNLSGPIPPEVIELCGKPKVTCTW